MIEGLPPVAGRTKPAVIADLGPYAECKESGVPWVGEIPAHWQVKRLKNWVAVNQRTIPELTAASYQFDYLDIGAVGTGRLDRAPQRLTFGSAPSRADG